MAAIQAVKRPRLRTSDRHLLAWLSHLWAGWQSALLIIQSGRPIRFAFGGVPDDTTIRVCISASSSYKTGRMRKYFMEATLLCRCPQFRRRIMVFTSSACWEGFKNQCDGLVDLSRIEAIVCDDLPDEMRKKVSEVYQESAREVGDKAAPGMEVSGKRQ